MARHTLTPDQAAFTPPPYRWWFIGLLGAEFLLVVWAIFHQFIPSDDWRSLSARLNWVLCAITVVYLTYMFWYNPHRLGQLFTPFKKWVAILSMPFFVYFLGYFSIMYGVGTLVSQSIGKPHVVFDTLHKHYVDSRKSCKTRLIGDAFNGAFPAFFCVSAEHFEQLPNTVAVNIHGQQSALGFYVESLEYDWLRTSFIAPPNHAVP